MSKLAIIVPHRNRERQLRKFLTYIKKYLTKFPWIEYKIFVVTQDDIKKFNRGKLLNIGFLEAEHRGYLYTVFHDVDMLPVDCSYDYSEEPLQLANRFRSTGGFKRTIQRDYFGGVTLFNIENFRKINGYSNKYRGWGFEDNDLLLRCREQNLPLEPIRYRTPELNKPAVRFNGKNSYVEIDNNLKFARPLTFTVSFYPDKIFCDPDEITDEYTIFGIPGYDLNLSYNSFSTYKFELFLTNEVAVSITSEFTPNIPARVAVTIDPKNKKVEFFFNGSKIYDQSYLDLDWQKSGIYRYGVEKSLFLGASAPHRKNKPKMYKGFIDSFAVYKRVLTSYEIRNLFTNINDNLLTDGINELDLQDTFYMYFDSRYIEDDRFIDLSGNNTYNKIVNCKVEDIQTDEYVEVGMPIRRPGTFSLLKHEEGGYIHGYWVDWSSRVNQLHYHSLTQNGSSNLEKDGLTTCRYKVKDIEEKNQIVYINART